MEGYPSLKRLGLAPHTLHPPTRLSGLTSRMFPLHPFPLA